MAVYFSDGAMANTSDQVTAVVIQSALESGQYRQQGQDVYLNIPSSMVQAASQQSGVPTTMTVTPVYNGPVGGQTGHLSFPGDTNPGGVPVGGGSPTGASQVASNTGLPYSPQAGYGYQVDAANYANQQQLQTMRDQSAERVAAMQAQYQLMISQGTNANNLEIAKMQNAIQQEQNRLHGLEVQIQQEAEQRQERQLQSQLAANPNDFVQYEYYKRMLGSPTTLSTAQSMMGGTATLGTGVQTGLGQFGGQYDDWLRAHPQYDMVMQNGQPTVVPLGGGNGGGTTGTTYSAAPPAYADSTLQSVTAGIQNGGADYNPNLGGTGAFGATIKAPNQLSRAQALNMSPSEQQIMNSFLSGGINMGNGKLTSIDPTDWWAQQQKSQVPTLSSVGGGTRYDQ